MLISESVSSWTNLDDVTLEGLEDGLAIFGGGMDKREHGNLGSLLGVKPWLYYKGK